jgi:FkbH-like protein/thioester reductase-like protein
MNLNISQEILSNSQIREQSIALQMFSLDNIYSYTYSDLRERLKTGAEQIKKAGIKSGDRIALISENRPEWVIAYLAALEAETTVVLIDPALTANDFQQQIETSDLRGLILSPRIKEKMPFAKTLKLPILNLEDELNPFEGMLKQIPHDILPTNDPDPEVASIIFTSGTSGFPKGVLVTHQSLLHCAKCGLDLIKNKSTNKYHNHNFLCILPLHHIAALTGLLIAPLLDGATVTFIEPVDKETIFETLIKTEITVLPAVPRFYDLIYKGIINQIELKGKLTQTIIRSLSSFSYWVRSVTSWNIGLSLFRSIHQAFGGKLQYCFCGASPLATEVKLGMEKLGFTMLEGYGLTEAGVCVYNTLNQSRIGNVGKPFQGIKIRIDKPNLTTGEGEICIRGISLMKGYFRDPDATAEVLRDGWLYTGDLGRLDTQGNLIITGRIKELIVTSGGKKVYPTVVEEYYRGLKGVKELAVFGMPTRDGLGESVHAAIVIDTIVIQPEFNNQEILKNLWQEIENRSLEVPTYLRIQKIHIIEELPKTTTLKVKRKELKKIVNSNLIKERQTSNNEDANYSNQTITLDRDTLLALPLEQRLEKLQMYLIDVVARILKIDLSLSDKYESLLALGIDSLNAVELVNRLRHELGWEIPIEKLLTGSNIEELATTWNESNTNLTQNKLTITPISERENLPLSYEQERLWFLDKIIPDNSIYNLFIPVEITGNLNINIFKQTLEVITQRHEILRSNFPMVNGSPKQVIALSPTIPLSIINLQHLAKAQHSEEVKRLTALESQKSFDLTNDILWRVTLLQLAEDNHILLLTMHHLISDVRSISIFLQELSTLYQDLLKGDANSLPNLAIQYVDFCYWQRHQRIEKLPNKELKYWRKQLEDISVKYPLVTDYSRPLKPTFNAGYYTFRINTNVWSSLKKLSKEQNVTPFITLLTAFNIFLNRVSGQTDIIVGSPVIGRNYQQLESLIGFFAYPIIFRNDLSNNPSFNELLQRVRKVVLDGYVHQNISFEDIIKVITTTKQQKYNSPFQILFSFVGNLAFYLNNSTLTMSPIWELFKAPTDLDLLLTILEVDSELICLLTYNSDLFKTQTIEDLMKSYSLILEQCIENQNNHLNQFYLQSVSNQNMVNVQKVQPISTTSTTNETLSRQLIITANFTIEPLIETLKFWFDKLNLEWNIKLAPYNQVFQQILTPDSLIAQNQNGVNLILLRLEDWINNNYNHQETVNDPQLQNTIVRDFINALKTLVYQSKATYILALCPNSPVINANLSEIEKNIHLQKLIEIELKEIPGLYLLNWDEILSKYPVKEFYDIQADQLANIPYTSLFFTALGTAIARKIYTIQQIPYKVIVLDCDYTLWQGICGEDTIDNINISEPYQLLQKFLLTQKKQGMLLCLCSKNNESDVFLVFEEHQKMLIKKDDLVSWRINWQSKSENLKSLSQELQLGLNSFIFIDDNPVECAEVKANCPEVLTIQLPQKAELISQFFKHIWSFDHLKTTTQEDSKRTLFYQQNIKRQEIFKESLTLGEFIKNLALKVEISSMSSEQILRVAQLTQRTNQFNNTTIRRSESEIQNLCQLQGYNCLVVEVEDRFGDYGLVGVMLFKEKAHNLEVDSFLLSCRVLGKGVEYQMLAYLGKIAQKQKLTKVIIPYKSTAKNEPILIFLTKIAQQYQKLGDASYYFELPTDFCADITYEPELVTFQDLPIKEIFTPLDITTDSVLINDIANNLYDVEIIEQTIKSQKQTQTIHQSLELQEPNQDQKIETQINIKGNLVTEIQKIMAEILDLPNILPTTDFFEAGGTSLDAVRLLCKINYQLNLNINLDDFFLNSTPELLSVLINPTVTPKSQEQELAILFTQDLELDLKQVPFQTQLWQPQSKIEQILLTGCTGNLGVFLLMDLLRLTDATVYCLIRSSNEEEGLERLRKAFESRKLLWSNEVKRRIRILPGDLSKPKFGWNKTDWIEYAEKIEAIYHCGADVHFTRPYQSVRQVTVEGTRTILAFACQTNIKPVHYVSTIGVFHSEECLQKESIKESDSLGNGMLLPIGYQQAKWVAEGLVTRAKERGVPIVIFRPGIIGPHSRTGVFSSQDLSVIFLKTVFKHRIMPHSRAFDVAPVDWVSRALVTISLQPDSIGQVFHLVHPQPIAVENLRRGSALAGFNLRFQSLEQWLKDVSIAAKEDTEHPMATLTPILEMQGAKNLMRILNLAPPVSVENTLKALEGTYTTCPPLERKQLEIWFDGFRQEDILPSLSQDFPYLWFKERFRGFCTLKYSLIETENIFKVGYEQGLILDSKLDIDITASISSIEQVFNERKIRVEGTVYCPLIDKEPLKIRSGYWQILTHETTHLQTDSELHWLRYYLELEDSQGNSFWLEGEKFIRLGWDLWKQTRTLNVSIRNSSGMIWVGQTIIPSESYLDDQVRGLRMDEAIPKSDRQRAKLLWLLLLWGSGGLTYLKLLLRFGSSIVYEYINKK